MDQILLYIFFSGLIALQLIWYKTDPRPFTKQLSYYAKFKNMYSRTGFFLFVLIFVFIALFDFKLPLQFPASMYDYFAQVFGTACYLTGLYFAFWARMTMKKKWLPAGEGHNIKSQSVLFTTGPFKYTRNPIYLGNLLMIIGMGIALRTYLVVLAVYPYWYFLNTIKQEEVLLKKYFGKKYVAYMAKVPRFL